MNRHRRLPEVADSSDPRCVGHLSSFGALASRSFEKEKQVPAIEPNDESHDYFVVWFRLNGEEGYLLSYLGSGIEDGVYVSRDRRVPAFRSLDNALDFARRHGISMYDESISIQTYPETGKRLLFNLDVAVSWMRDLEPGKVDCLEFLNTINLCVDVAASVSTRYNPWENETVEVYNKLFWGSNLPAMTPEGENYAPVWGDDDMRLLADALARGLAIFREYVVLAR